MILGTAGHIDHGKTALVRALTGIDCDRLSEEKRRGITIELGFAFTPLPDGSLLGIVDVPGHERFVKTMVSGAAGMDMVMLVIAADEAIMPQTREHLEICSLLGIKDGFIVLTKCDLVEEEWLALVEEDIARFAKGTFLENSPVFHVSAVTGQGLEELREHIFTQVQRRSSRKRADVFRLPIDRVFSLKGHGTIVTGTVLSGTLRAGEEVFLMPAGLAGRARGLQNHGEAVDSVSAGQRCAVNVQNLEVKDVERGFVLTRPGELVASRRWIVRLACLDSAPRPLRQRAEIHFHHGARECPARILFFGRDRLSPGENALAEVRFNEDMVGIFNDHCVLRAGSPLRAVAGGVLISPLASSARGRSAERQKRLALLERLSALQLDGVAGPELPETALLLQDKAGANKTWLKLLTGLEADVLETNLKQLAAQGKALCFDEENGLWLNGAIFEQLLADCLKKTAELHAKFPLNASFPRGALAANWGEGLPEKLIAKVLAHALKRGRLESEGDGLRLAGHKVRLDAGADAVRLKLLAACREAGAAPPNMPEILNGLKISEKEAAPVLKLLCEDKSLVKIKEGLYYEAAAFEAVLEKVRLWFRDHENLDLANLKEILGLSRKYLIALLEYMDKERITVRIGDARRLRIATS
jgi:selenocysteine-specific elongation factor